MFQKSYHFIPPLAGIAAYWGAAPLCSVFSSLPLLGGILGFLATLSPLALAVGATLIADYIFRTRLAFFKNHIVLLLIGGTAFFWLPVVFSLAASLPFLGSTFDFLATVSPFTLALGIAAVVIGAHYIFKKPLTFFKPYNTPLLIATGTYLFGGYFLLLAIAKYVFGWGVGRLILLSQNTILKPHKNSSELGENEYIVHAKNGATLHSQKFWPNPEKNADTYIIYCCPNAESFTENKGELQTFANTFNRCVVGFDYPNVGRSTGWIYSETQLVEAVLAQITNLHEAGIPLKNIALYGLSIGGAAATMVPEQDDTSLINDRSLSDMSYTIAGLLLPNAKWAVYPGVVLAALLRPLLYALHWEMDVVTAWEKIPMNRKHLIVSKEDTIINYRIASLYQAIKPDLKKAFSNQTNSSLYKTVTRSYKIQTGHGSKFIHCERWISNDRLRNKATHNIEQVVGEFLNPNIKQSR